MAPSVGAPSLAPRLKVPFPCREPARFCHVLLTLCPRNHGGKSPATAPSRPPSEFVLNQQGQVGTLPFLQPGCQCRHCEVKYRRVLQVSQLQTVGSPLDGKTVAGVGIFFQQDAGESVYVAGRVLLLASCGAFFCGRRLWKCKRRLGIAPHGSMR